MFQGLFFKKNWKKNKKIYVWKVILFILKTAICETT